MTAFALPARRQNAWRERMAQGAGALVALALIGLASSQPDLPSPARAAFIVFIASVWFWIFTRIEPAYVAVAAAGALWASGTLNGEALLHAASADVVWLIAAMFVVGEAVERSGLAARWREAALMGAHTTTGVFWRMSLLLGLMAFVVPSTSARAALAMPAMRSLFPRPDDPRRRAFALLIPTIILLTTSAALTGAASHLVANDVLHAQTGQRISHLQWALWGAPFALAVGAFACFAIPRLFLSAEERAEPLAARERQDRARLSAREWRALLVVAALVATWLSAPLHTVSIPLAALAAAALLAAPKLGVISARAAVSAVQWRFLLFAAGALTMGAALIGSGAGAWAMEKAWSAFGAAQGAWVSLAAISAISMASHLFITSHIARAAILTPSALSVAAVAGIDPAGVVFLAMAGANFCLTFPVSSKALMLFARDEYNVRSGDSMLVSALIAPVYFALLLAWAAALWL